MMRHLRALFDALRRERLSRELREELQFHEAQLIRDARADGLSPRDAEAVAHRRLGNTTAIVEDVRAMWTIPWIEQLTQDVRYGFRSLCRSPAFAIVTVLTLALGIGATTAIFTVVNAVMLRPLPYKDPERLVLLGERTHDTPWFGISYPNYQDWRPRMQVFEDVALYSARQFTLTKMGNAERVLVGWATGNLFDVLGVTPAKGRLLQRADDHVGAARVVVLTHSAWTRRFGRDSQVVGKTMTLDDVNYAIVGVLPPSVQLSGVEMWLPLAPFVHARPFTDRSTHGGLIGMARLRKGIGLSEMQRALDHQYALLRATYAENAGISATGNWLTELTVGDVRRPLFLLSAAVLLMLLVACANVANLMLARAVARSREMALRVAIGARRRRIIQQLLTESALLSIIGGALGIGVAWITLRGFLALNPEGIPRLHEIAIDTDVLMFAVGVSLLTGILFGLVPALHTIRRDVSGALRDGARGASASKATLRIRTVLMLAEVSLTLVLLVGAGLFARTFQKLTRAETGVEANGVVVGLVSLPSKRYPDSVRQRQMFSELIEKVKATPGVSDVAGASDLPIFSGWQTPVTFLSLPPVAPGNEMHLNAATVSLDWFQTMRIRIVAGRTFSRSDVDGINQVVVISEAIARRFFGSANPVGQRLKIGPAISDSPPLEIIGVVGDVANDGPRVPSRGTLYVPLEQQGAGRFWIAARTTMHSANVAVAIRGALAEIDKEIPLVKGVSLEAIVAEEMAQPRFSMMMFGAFAVVALMLAAIGVYGVISYAVAQRTHEIGVRIALGAGRFDVIGMVARQVMIVTGIGITVGVVGALIAGRALERLLFGVTPTDAVTLLVSCCVIALVAAFAAAIPAWRASKLDPVSALRAD